MTELRPAGDEEVPFWRRKTLGQLSEAEWESLCDGCGQCCRVKLQDQETGIISSTAVACRLLDLETCRCSDYPRRHEEVPSCLRLTAETVPRLAWLPETCGYRRVAEGKDLEPWHPLRSGDPEGVHRAGISVRGQVLSEADVGDLEALLHDWYGVEPL